MWHVEESGKEVSPTLINPCRESKMDKEKKNGENERREKMR